MGKYFSLINDLKYSSFSKISSTIDGLMTNYKLLFRNLNSSTDNSDTFKNGEDQQLLSIFSLENSFSQYNTFFIKYLYCLSEQ